MKFEKKIFNDRCFSLFIDSNRAAGFGVDGILTHTHLVHHDRPESLVALTSEHPRGVDTAPIAADTERDLALINICNNKNKYLTNNANVQLLL